jgi:hypothetical protein
MSVDRILTMVVLPAPLGAEQGEDGARRDAQVDAVQYEVVTVGFAQAGGGDGVVVQDCSP